MFESHVTFEAVRTRRKGSGVVAGSIRGMSDVASSHTVSTPDFFPLKRAVLGMTYFMPVTNLSAFRDRRQPWRGA